MTLPEIKIAPGPWRIDDRTATDGARGHVICNVELAFDTVAIRAEPTGLACPSVRELDALGMAHAGMIRAIPEILAFLRDVASYECCCSSQPRTGSSCWQCRAREIIAASIAR